VLEEILNTVPVPQMPATGFHKQMKWILGTLALLVLGLGASSSACWFTQCMCCWACLLLSRVFTRTWTEKIEAAVSRGRIFLEIGEQHRSQSGR
jgi:hypothetical protein